MLLIDVTYLLAKFSLVSDQGCNIKPIVFIIFMIITSSIFQSRVKIEQRKIQNINSKVDFYQKSESEIVTKNMNQDMIERTIHSK